MTASRRIPATVPRPKNSLDTVDFLSDSPYESLEDKKGYSEVVYAKTVTQVRDVLIERIKEGFCVPPIVFERISEVINAE